MHDLSRANLLPNLPALRDFPLLGSLRRNRLMISAACLTGGGWTLMWAQALSIVRWMPLWTTVIVFFFGLALIPFGIARAPTR